MDFEWDETKASANLLKHGVDFADVAPCFEDERALTLSDPDSGGEERFLTLAMDAYGRILVTCFTYRDTAIRIISSRKASPGECRRYERKL
jgi:uncharacterized protein